MNSGEGEKKAEVYRSKLHTCELDIGVGSDIMRDACKFGPSRISLYLYALCKPVTVT